ncbi:ProQ/FINO family protein [Klebsiella aerogenes]
MTEERYHLLKVGITRDMWDNQQARGPNISNKRLRRVLKTLSRLVSYLQALQAGRGR